MENSKEVNSKKAIERFKDFTSLKNSRKVLLKMYFSSNRGVLSKDDQEEVFFLYNLLEDME